MSGSSRAELAGQLSAIHQRCCSMSDASWRRVSICSILVLGLLRLVACGDAKNDGFQRVFQTEESVRQLKAQQMHRQMNLKADPCTDFYEYACGNWDTTTTKELQLQKSVDTDLIRLLEEAHHGQDSPVAHVAKDFFKSCQQAQGQHSHQQQQFLSEFIQQNGGFPAVPGSKWSIYQHSYDWLQVLGKLRKEFGMDILIGLRIGYNYAKVQENSIYLTEPSTMLPRELCKRQRLQRRDPAYEPIEQLVAEQLKMWLALGNEESARLAKDIVNFEHELCSGMHELEPWNADLNIYKANFTRKTLAELGHIYGIELDAYVTQSFGQNVYRPVYMAAPEYYKQLRRTLDSHNSSQLANYIMYRAVAELTFPLEENPQQSQNHRPRHCLERAKRWLPSALGELYARQYASDEARQELYQLYEQLKSVLKKSVSAEWLQESSRRVAQQKLSNLLLMLPSYEMPLSLRLQLDSNNYWANLRKILASVQTKQLDRLFEEDIPTAADPVESYESRVVYRPVAHRIELGWALLQPPEHDSRYGNALRYATLGSALAEQMVKSFDAMHWSVGLREHDNWDFPTAHQYQMRSSCFSRQVEEYMRPNATATDLLINRSASLNIAFNGYLTWLRYQEPNNDFNRLSKETLPGLNYANTALFFIALAQQHCNPLENQFIDPNLWPNHTYSIRQHHSWTRLLVNGPLSNLPDFAREFRCPLGTPMNPAQKCSIY